jgi:hypothetical protein
MNADSDHRMLRLVAAGAVLLGVALRLWLYLENRSLWLDPAMLALNVIGKDPGQLLQRLDMNQAAPAGFLLASKAVGSLCDYSEYSLRLLPLAFGIAALVFFVGLSVRLLGPVRAPLAYVPLATGSTAIFYSAEFRPQSADLCWAVIVLFVSHQVLARKWSLSAIVAFAAVATVAQWFSFPVAFVVAGSGVALVLLALIAAERRAALRLMVACALVAAHFVVLYLLLIRPSVGSDLYSANTATFAPIFASSGSQRWWWALAVKGYFEYPMGFRWLFVVPLAALAIGVVIGFSERRYRPAATLLGAPVVVLVAASGLGLYPISTGIHEVKSRFVLFTVPMALVFVAIGTSRVCEALGRRRWLVSLVIALLLVPSLSGGFVGPRFQGQELRPLIRYLEQHIRPGDVVYVYHASAPAFRYYTRRNPIEAVFGLRPSRGPASLKEDLERVRHAPRLWVFVSHAYGGERRVIRRALRAMGSEQGFHRTLGAVLFEYEINRRSP